MRADGLISADAAIPPSQEKVNRGGPPLRRYEEQMEDDNIFSSIEKIPPPLSEEKKGADVQLGADTSAYMYPGSGPYHPSVLLYTHHISFLYFFLSSRLWLYRKM